MKLTYANGDPVSLEDFLAILRSTDEHSHDNAISGHWMHLAADTIERLQKELQEADFGHKVLEGEIRHRNERFDRLVDHRARAENDLRVVEQERDAALAEVDLWKWKLDQVYREAERDARDAYRQGRLDEHEEGRFDQWGYPT